MRFFAGRKQRGGCGASNCKPKNIAVQQPPAKSKDNFPEKNSVELYESLKMMDFTIADIHENPWENFDVIELGSETNCFRDEKVSVGEALKKLYDSIVEVDNDLDAYLITNLMVVLKPYQYSALKWMKKKENSLLCGGLLGK